jgi:hypothetical protein
MSREQGLPLDTRPLSCSNCRAVARVVAVWKYIGGSVRAQQVGGIQAENLIQLVNDQHL